MSHWQSGKIEVRCSLSLLEKSIIDMMADWKDHIYTSEGGDLSLYNYQGIKDAQTYHLVIPGCGNKDHSKAPHLRYSDIGIRKGENGQWEIKVDISGMPKDLQKFEGKLAASIAAIKVKRIANSKKNKQTADFMRGNKRCIRLIAPVEDKYRIHA